MRPIVLIATLALTAPLSAGSIQALAQVTQAAPADKDSAVKISADLQAQEAEASLPQPQNAPVRPDWRTTLQLFAILAAVGIFAFREILEWLRRRSARKNRLKALKAIIARECELNNYTTSVLLHDMKTMRANFELDDDDPYKYDYRVVFRRDGSAILERTLGGEWSGSGPIPKVHSAIISAKLMDVAELDFELYALAEAALSGLAELEHVRMSLISGVLKEDENMPDMIEGLPDYAIREIEDAASALKELYRACTGRPLTDRRLR